MKIRFKTGTADSVIDFLPSIRIYKAEFSPNWKRFALELGFLKWRIGWLFAFVPYCEECGVYFKHECNCDDDWLDTDEEYDD